ncbi:MAG: septation protein A [Sphingomonadales bacterium]|jgi:intracellular septation protein
MNDEVQRHVKAENPWLKLLVEFGPLIVFFIANNRFGIFTATAAFMVAMVIAIAYTFITTKRVPPMLWVTGIVVGLFGGLTLYFEDELFIKLKPTVVNSLFAMGLGLGLVMKKPFLKTLFGPAFPPLTDKGWTILTARWAMFFVFLAILNEVVWRNTTTDFWVGFKLWGLTPLSLIFAAAQIPVILKHQLPVEEGAA